MKNKKIILDGMEVDPNEIRSSMNFERLAKKHASVKTRRSFHKIVSGIIIVIATAAIISVTQKQDQPAVSPLSQQTERSEPATATKSNMLVTQALPADSQKTALVKPGVTSIQENNPKPDYTRNFRKYSSLSDYFKSRALQPQLFTINASRDTSITGKQGTILTIKASSFVDLKENPVTGAIAIELKECYTAEDMLRENLTTLSGNKILESGGMIYIGAKGDGRQLKLKKFQEIAIQNPFPEVTADTSMHLYYGKRNSSGDINWTVDSCSRVPYPIATLSKGKFLDTILIEYFAKIYRFEKRSMLDFMSSRDSIPLSVTLDETRKVIGHEGVTPAEGSALYEFVRLFQKERIPKVSSASWKTNFTFKILSENNYTKYLVEYKKYQKEENINKGNFVYNITNDSTQGWKYQRDIARFYAGETGWVNFDKRFKNERTIGERLAGSFNNLRVKSSAESNEELTLMFKGSLLKGISILKPVKVTGGWIFTNIPVGKEVTITATLFRDDLIYTASKKVKVKMKEPLHELNYSPQF